MRTKLDEATARRIIAMSKAGTRNSVIAREVGISRMHVGRIVKGRIPIWAPLLDEDTNAQT